MTPQETIQKATDEGRLLEAGWLGYLYQVVAPCGAGDVQIEETRRAFYAGANMLFASIMTMLEAGAEPTENDLSRMDRIYAELQEFKPR